MLYILFHITVITNKPEELKVVNISSQSVTIKWRPPIMRNLVNPLPLQYEILIRHIFHESADIMVSNYTLCMDDLFQYFN